MTQIPADSGRYEQFLTLFAQHHDRLYRYVFSLAPRHQDAEDIFQKTSLVLWRKFDQLEPDGEFFPWAAKVAYFEVRNHRRTHARDRHFFSAELMATLAEERTAKRSSQTNRVAALRDCLKRLPEGQRELVRGVYDGGRSVTQIAEEMGRAVQTVYNRLYRIRRALFDCVQRKILSEEATS